MPVWLKRQGSQLLTNSTDHYSQIQNDLKSGIEKLRQKYPEGFSKPIRVLAPVDDDVEDQWEQILQQSGEDHVEANITLISYYLGDLHWTGVIIEFR
ncbi:unnamed protein product [Rotaria sp. Silwood2]|nr:unnamed protein product [Rotaria sp. Silwood2]